MKTGRLIILRIAAAGVASTLLLSLIPDAATAAPKRVIVNPPVVVQPSTVNLPVALQPAKVLLPVEAQPSTVNLPVALEPAKVLQPVELEPSTVTPPDGLDGAKQVAGQIVVNDASGAIAMKVPRDWDLVDHPGRYIELSALGDASSNGYPGMWIAVPALNGARGAVSLRSRQFPNRYLRHQNFRLKLHATDGSKLFRNDSSFYARRGLNGLGGMVSFEATNMAGYYMHFRSGQLWMDRSSGNPALFANDATFRQSTSNQFRNDHFLSLESSNLANRYLRHRNAFGELSPVDPASNLDRADATWIQRPALSGVAGAVSFESVNYPGTFLRHQNFRLTQQADDGSDSSTFRLDVSFYPRSGLAGGSTTSFESVNFPGSFLRHQNFQFWLAANDGSGLFSNDASFIERFPLFVRAASCTSFFRQWRKGYEDDQMMELCTWVMGINQYCASQGAHPMVGVEDDRRSLVCWQNYRESTFLEEIEDLATGAFAQFIDAANAAAPFVTMAVSAVACGYGAIFACATLALDLAQRAGVVPEGIAREALEAADQVAKCADGDIVACAQVGSKGARAAGVKIPGDVAKAIDNGQKCLAQDFKACATLGLMAADAAGVPFGLGQGDVADGIDCSFGDDEACVALAQRAVQAGTGVPLGGVRNGADNARRCAAGDVEACISLGRDLATAAG